MDIKKKKEFPYSTVLLLVLVLVPLIAKHPWELLYFALAPKLSLLRPWKDCLKPPQPKSLPPSLMHTLLPQDTSPHHFSTLPGLYFFSWVKSGHSLAQPSLEKSSLHADPTSITSCCVQLHLPSAELHWMGTFPLAFMPIHLHHLLVLYADQILSQETHWSPTASPISHGRLRYFPSWSTCCAKLSHIWKPTSILHIHLGLKKNPNHAGLVFQRDTVSKWQSSLNS